MSVKLGRLNSIFAKEISRILMTEIKDEHIQFVTITGCDITSDLSFAKVYFTVLDEEKKDDILKSLEKASPFIRTKLAAKVKVRHTPELRFAFDESVLYGDKIERKIKELHGENI